MNLSFELATEEDIPTLTEVMTRTFDDDTQKHLGEPKGGPPDYDSEEFFYPYILRKETGTVFRIILDEKIIGGFVVFIFRHGNNSLGRIFIDPTHQNKGIGLKAWKFIENNYPKTKSWTLDTPEWAKRNHHFYEKKCGFKKIEEETVEGGGILFIFQKKL
ncbi:MAG: GNAT family N-acetyltransferase [Candidatus Heimdallarchaeota archaeon]|nr:MAG: GNAT family N-acetyltransferase [Candidatus Heimdallarchaeota archaeon]